MFGLVAAATVGALGRIPPDHGLAFLAWGRAEGPEATQIVPRFGPVHPIPADSIAAAADSVARALALPGPPSRPEILLARSRRHAARWNGGQLVPGMFLPPRRIVLADDVRTPILLLHELVHWQLFQSWGPPHADSAWLNEGLATFVAGRCADRPARVLAAAMRRAGRLPSLAHLLTEFDTIPSLVAYVSAASLIEWFVASGQRDVLPLVWREGVAALQSVPQLEADWHAFLAGGPRVAWQPELGCFGARGA